MSATGNLPELHFEHFLGYEELTEFVTALAASRPDLVSLSSIGTSRDGRAIHLLTITDPSTGPAQDKPAYLIHGNIHAVELAGTHAALFTARQLLADAPKSDVLQRTTFYIIPRLNPDGGEFAVTTSGSIRSRTDRSDRVPNTLYQEDVNDDGRILTMRLPHPNGTFVADPEDPRLLVRRTRDSKPPFYRTLPEGLIYHWDGTDHVAVEGRSLDWNRNWSYDWRPEPEQWGAGDFPFSETEMRALADFIFSRPNIFAILGYHTGPNAVLRPPSTGADSDMDEADVRIMQELAEIGAEHTGFPVVPVVKYRRNDARDINLRGHFHDFGYRHLGLFVFEFELGILMNSAGISTPDIFGVRSDQEHEALMRRTLAWWDTQKKRDSVFAPWTPFDHPQLGHTEIGGLLHRHVSNPTLDDLKRIAAGTYKFTLAHVSRQPRIALEEARAERVADGTYRIRARVANRGEFPTHVSNRGRGLRRLQGVRVEFHPGEGVRLLSEAGHRVLGHLGGLTDGRDLEWFVAAEVDTPVLCELRALGGAGGNVSVSVVPSD
ncbi:MAG: M14 family metallopeptidase [Bacteroidota bacterium]